jgi:hypothetical protein
VGKQSELAHPTQEVWEECYRLFRNHEDILWFMKCLRFRNSLAIANSLRPVTREDIRVANGAFRNSKSKTLRRFCVTADHKTIDKPFEEWVIHLYEIRHVKDTWRTPAR